MSILIYCSNIAATAAAEQLQQYAKCCVYTTGKKKAILPRAARLHHSTVTVEMQDFLN